MSQTEKVHRTDPALEYYTPDRVLETAYSYYVVDFYGDVSKPTVNLAKQVVHDFETVCAVYQLDSHESEWKFISSLKPVIVSLARGIGRRRWERQDLLDKALEQRQLAVQALTNSSFRSGLLRAVYRTVIIGGFSYFLTRTFIPWISFDHPVSPTYASMAVSLGSILFSSWLSGQMFNQSIQKIFNAYDSARLHAEEAYRRTVKEEYIRSKKDASLIWTRYMRRAPKEWPGYETILEEESELAEMHERQRRDLSLSTFGHLKRQFTNLRNRKTLKVQSTEK